MTNLVFTEYVPVQPLIRSIRERCKERWYEFDIHELMGLVQSASRESKVLDFKRKFDTNSPQDWCEIIKDVVAMANSGGGVIVVGVEDDGTPATADVQPVLDLDLADISNKVRSHTSLEFDGVEIVEIYRTRHRTAAIFVSGVSVPMVFTSPGDFKYPSGKIGMAFAKGTVYFRHGAKSEPGTTDDIRRCIETEIESLREAWLSNIRKVVEAPSDAVVHVLRPGDQPPNRSEPTPVRISNDPTAPTRHAINKDETHPYRLKDVIEILNGELRHTRPINNYDIRCVRVVHSVDDQPDHFYLSQLHNNTAQYSHNFVEWLIEEFNRDREFFDKAREKYAAMGRPSVRS